jgi:hypothetical protein
MKFLKLSTILFLFLCFFIVHSEVEQPVLTKEQQEKLHQAFFNQHMKNFKPPPESVRLMEDMRKLNEKLTMEGLNRLKQIEQGTLISQMNELTGKKKKSRAPSPPKNPFKKNKKDEL